MFGVLKNNEPQQPDWLTEAKQSRDRWFVFLDKLEAKMEELCTEAIPALEEMRRTDDDIYKRAFLRMQSGIQGQLSNIRDKAYQTHEEKITSFYSSLTRSQNRDSPYYGTINDLRNECSDRYHQQFEEKCTYWRQKISDTALEDLEIKYQAVLQEYESIKEKFTCKQCGAGMVIPKIFFISSYLPCPHCQTQNTFEPGTQAQLLQHFAQELAQQRTATLYEAYQNEQKKERALYHEKHELHLSAVFETDKKIKAEKEKKEQELEAQRQASIVNAPKLYEKYIRAKYAEWKKITPDLEVHLEKRLQDELARI